MVMGVGSTVEAAEGANLGAAPTNRRAVGACLTLRQQDIAEHQTIEGEAAVFGRDERQAVVEDFISMGLVPYETGSSHKYLSFDDLRAPAAEGQCSLRLSASAGYQRRQIGSHDRPDPSLIRCVQDCRRTGLPLPKRFLEPFQGNG